MLFGFSYLYGTTGTTSISEITALFNATQNGRIDRPGILSSGRSSAVVMLDRRIRIQDRGRSPALLCRRCLSRGGHARHRSPQLRPQNQPALSPCSKILYCRRRRNLGRASENRQAYLGPGRPHHERRQRAGPCAAQHQAACWPIARSHTRLHARGRRGPVSAHQGRLRCHAAPSGRAVLSGRLRH